MEGHILQLIKLTPFDCLSLQVCYSQLTFSGPITNLTAGHIHNGTAGVSGPILVPLFAGVPAPYACTSAAPATLAAIVADPSECPLLLEVAEKVL